MNLNRERAHSASTPERERRTRILALLKVCHPDSFTDAGDKIAATSLAQLLSEILTVGTNGKIGEAFRDTVVTLQFNHNGTTIRESSLYTVTSSDPEEVLRDIETTYDRLTTTETNLGNDKNIYDGENTIPLDQFITDIESIEDVDQAIEAYNTFTRSLDTAQPSDWESRWRILQTKIFHLIEAALPTDPLFNQAYLDDLCKVGAITPIQCQRLIEKL